MSLRARRRGQLRPGRGGPRVEIRRAIDPAVGAVGHGSIESCGIVRIQRQSNDGFTQIFQARPCRALVCRIHYLP